MCVDHFCEAELLHDYHVVGVPDLEGVVSGTGGEEPSVMGVPLHHGYGVGRGCGFNIGATGRGGGGSGGRAGEWR